MIHLAGGTAGAAGATGVCGATNRRRICSPKGISRESSAVNVRDLPPAGGGPGEPRRPTRTRRAGRAPWRASVERRVRGVLDAGESRHGRCSIATGSRRAPRPARPTSRETCAPRRSATIASIAADACAAQRGGARERGAEGEQAGQLRQGAEGRMPSATRISTSVKPPERRVRSTRDPHRFQSSCACARSPRARDRDRSARARPPRAASPASATAALHAGRVAVDGQDLHPLAVDLDPRAGILGQLSSRPARRCSHRRRRRRAPGACAA
jgi:hypothetical protein